MTTGIIHDGNTQEHTEKHMGGCIAGFFHIFDRNHVVSSKRFFPKRLPSSDGIESISSVGSPAISSEFDRSNPRESAKSVASPAVSVTPPAAVRDVSARSSIAVSSFDFKEGLKSPSKLTRELPRLSLDSRLNPRGIRTKAGGVRYDDAIETANDDGSETQKRSPSVVARLMGLEPFIPSSNSGGGGDFSEKVERRRSASESRSKDLLHCRLIEGNMLPANAQYRSNSGFSASAEIREKTNGSRCLSKCNTNVPAKTGNARSVVHPEQAMRPRRMIAQQQQQQRKGLYDCGEFFPEPKMAVPSIYGIVEKRLKMRGVEEPSKDLDALKQILDSLQFEGLLRHSNPPASRIGRRDFVNDRRFPSEESPVVVMKPVRSPRRISTEPSPPRSQSKNAPRRNLNFSGMDKFSSSNPRRNPATSRRSESRSISPVEKQKRLHETTSTEARRVSLVQSPGTASRRLNQLASQSPRKRKPAAEIRQVREEDESSTVSESCFSTSSRTDTEKPKTEGSCNDDRSLIERCDKLLNNISEMSSTSKNSTESQLSPVSVLDSSLYRDDESPSPVIKRAIDIKDVEDETWSPLSIHEDPNVAYMSEIIRASNNLPGHTDTFSMLEKRQPFNARDSSNSSILQRRLIFDTITEILDRNKQRLSPWKPVSCESQISQILSELQRIQQRDESEDLFEVICGVMKRDLAQDSINGWGDCQLEWSEAVIDVERLIFKDLIGETIRDLMGSSESRRKLVF
ncbi:hypothetical protein V2J09_004985 [Rumex salicifolius]